MEPVDWAFLTYIASALLVGVVGGVAIAFGAGAAGPNPRPWYVVLFVLPWIVGAVAYRLAS